MMPYWRLLLVSEPGRDGAFMVVRSLVRHIHSKHSEVSLDLAYSSCRASGALDEVVHEVTGRGGKVVDLRVANAPQKADFLAVNKLLALVRERRPALVHAHSSKAGALVRLCALSPRFPPILYTPHAYYGMPGTGGAKERLVNLVEGVIGHIGQTQNCSEDERDFALKRLRLPAGKLRVINNGVDVLRFAPAKESEKALSRAALGLPAAGRLLVTVGRDSSQKNFQPLYQALDRVLPETDWRFAHAGAGSQQLRHCLRETAARKCHAFEFLPDSSVLLKAADAFILPSRYEGLSLSMLEALSCGLFMILTEAPGLRVLRTMGFRGIRWLPDPSIQPSISAPIESALRQWMPPTAEERVLQVRLSHEFFTEERQMEKVVQLYQTLTKDS